jgi:hypothetical protein
MTLYAACSRSVRVISVPSSVLYRLNTPIICVCIICARVYYVNVCVMCACVLCVHVCIMCVWVLCIGGCIVCAHVLCVPGVLGGRVYYVRVYCVSVRLLCAYWVSSNIIIWIPYLQTDRFHGWLTWRTISRSLQTLRSPPVWRIGVEQLVA